MALYLKKLAVFDTRTNTVAQLVNVMEGVDGSAVFGYNVETEAIARGSNQKQNVKEIHTFDVRVIDDNGTTAGVLQGATQNANVCQFAGLSGDSVFVWDEPTILTAPPQYDTITNRMVMATLQQPPGYNGTAPNKKAVAYGGGNMLSLYDVQAGSANYLNGFEALGDATASVSGSVQSLTQVTPDGGFQSKPIMFPFAGEIITASILINTGASGIDLGFEFLDKDKVSLSTSVSTSTGTGRKSHTATIPANTVYVKFRMTLTGSPTAVITSSFPAIRVGYETAYVN